VLKKDLEIQNKKVKIIEKELQACEDELEKFQVRVNSALLRFYICGFSERKTREVERGEVYSRYASGPTSASNAEQQNQQHHGDSRFF
jgi:hypothetical protein